MDTSGEQEGCEILELALHRTATVLRKIHLNVQSFDTLNTLDTMFEKPRN